MRTLTKPLRALVLPLIRRIPVLRDFFRASTAYYETLTEWHAAKSPDTPPPLRVHEAFEVTRSRLKDIAVGISANFQDGSPPFTSYMQPETSITYFAGGYVCTDVCEVMTPD